MCTGHTVSKLCGERALDYHLGGSGKRSGIFVLVYVLHLGISWQSHLGASRASARGKIGMVRLARPLLYLALLIRVRRSMLRENGRMILTRDKPFKAWNRSSL